MVHAPLRKRKGGKKRWFGAKVLHDDEVGLYSKLQVDDSIYTSPSEPFLARMALGSNAVAKDNHSKTSKRLDRIGAAPSRIPPSMAILLNRTSVGQGGMSLCK